MRHHASRIAVAAAVSGVFATSAHAAGFKAGDWDLDVGGIINAYYTTVTCSGDQNIGGLALAGKALGCGGKDGRTTIGNGLLPDALTTSAKTRQDGLDIGATILIAVHTATDSAVAANSGVDVRRAFMTVGTGDIGTFKIGRDGGLFGDRVIFSDMTLLGAGMPIQATQRGRVTLGHIGAGYTYLGYYGQLSYTSPTSSGFSVSGGVFSPVNDTFAGNYDSGKSPQFQAIVDYSAGMFKAWVAAKSQQFEATSAANGNFTMNAVEAGGSLAYGDFGAVANVQTGKGLGILTDGDSGNTKQTNYFLQGTYKVTPKVKLGLNYGQSRLKDGTGTGLKSNSNVTAGLYYSLTKSVTLVGEVGQTRSKDFASDTAKLNGVSLGAIAFF